MILNVAIVPLNPLFWFLIFFLCILFFLLSSLHKKKKETNFSLPKNYLILEDIHIAYKEEIYDIDYLILSKYGLFVVSNISRNGIITGHEMQKKWCQFIDKNYYFDNPVIKNYQKIKALEFSLGIPEKKWISIVCFSDDSRLKTETKSITTHRNLLEKTVLGYQKEIVTEDLFLLKKKIERLQIPKDIVSSKKKERESKICPNCGGKLVIRDGKYGSFIGCSNYPNCTYTRNIK